MRFVLCLIFVFCLACVAFAAPPTPIQGTTWAKSFTVTQAELFDDQMVRIAPMPGPFSKYVTDPPQQTEDNTGVTDASEISTATLERGIAKSEATSETLVPHALKIRAKTFNHLVAKVYDNVTAARALAYHACFVKRRIRANGLGVAHGRISFYSNMLVKLGANPTGPGVTHVAHQSLKGAFGDAWVALTWDAVNQEWDAGGHVIEIDENGNEVAVPITGSYPMQLYGANQVLEFDTYQNVAWDDFLQMRAEINLGTVMGMLISEIKTQTIGWSSGEVNKESWVDTDVSVEFIEVE